VTWWRRPAVVALLVAAAAAFVFAPSVHGPWIYDDHLLIPENPFVHSMTWWPRWYMTGFWDVSEEFVRLSARPLTTYWRPTITATYAIDWQLGGGTPFIFHVTNLLWHAAVGALSFVVLRRWLGSLWAAALAAALFAVHPTKTECVAWIAGRTDVVCMVGMLVATQGIARRLRGAPGGFLLEVAGTILAYTTKEQSIVLPAFAAVEGWVAADRPAISWASILKMLKIAWPQLAVAITYLALRHFLLPMSGPKLPGPNAPPLDHIQAVFESAGRYVTLTFAPHDLSIQHGLVRMEHGVTLHSMPYMVIGALGFAALIGAAVFARKRLPGLTLGITFFLMTVSPTLNLVDMQMETLISERFLYLPMLGLALAFGALIVRWPTKATYAAAGLAVAVLGAITIDRSLDYSNETKFWARELEMHPRSPEARRARARLAISEKRYQGALTDTLELLRSASQRQDVSASMDACQLLSDLTPDHDKASLTAIDAFAADLLARRRPAATLEAKGLSLTVPTTTSFFEFQLKSNTLRLLRLRSTLRSRLGDDAAAIELAKDALTMCPRCTSSVVGAAIAFARASQYDEAFAVVTQAEAFIASTTLGPVRKMIEESATQFMRSTKSSGPAQLQALSAAHAALELWGRAYDVLAPYKEEIKTAPKLRLAFAELAFRAGETDIAREVLVAAGEPNIDARFAEWAAAMGWR